METLKSFPYVAIDPGNNGAAVFMSCKGRSHRVHRAIDMPTIKEQIKAKTKIRTTPEFDEICAIADEIWLFNPKYIFIEMQWARGTDSAMTAFTLGGWFNMLRLAVHAKGYGLHEGYELPSASAWKRWKPYAPYGLWGSGEDGKQIAIDMFSEIFPEDYQDHRLQPLYKNSKTRRRKPRDGRADAALLGLYGACEMKGAQLPLILEKPANLVLNNGKCALF